MSAIYLDVEFTDFHGELMSLALVPEQDNIPAFYLVLKEDEYKKPSAWVMKNVVPHLALPAKLPHKAVTAIGVTREFAAVAVASYLSQFDHVEIVADWPEDFTHFTALLLTGPGRMVPMPDFDMHYRGLKGFNTADASKLPHNALYDAVALRDYCVGL